MTLSLFLKAIGVASVRKLSRNRFSAFFLCNIAESGGPTGKTSICKVMKIQSKNREGYNAPRMKVVEVKATNLICSSPGGNEDPEDFPIG